jgi:hypothetical protein
MEGQLDKNGGVLRWRPDECAAGEDMGTAWVFEPDGTKRLINGGDPISRTEAERLAAAGNNSFDPGP